LLATAMAEKFGDQGLLSFSLHPGSASTIHLPQPLPPAIHRPHSFLYHSLLLVGRHRSVLIGRKRYFCILRGWER